METRSKARTKGVREALLAWPPAGRLWLGLFLCALASFYTAIAVVAVFGVWRNTFTHWNQNFVASLPLVIANAVGWKLKKLVAANLVAIGLLVAYHTVFVYAARGVNLSWDWPLFTAYVLLPLCNVQYFKAWCRAVELD